MIRTRFALTLVPLAVAALMIRLSRRTGDRWHGARLSRRTLIKLAGVAVTAVATSSWRGRSTTEAASTGAVSCVLAPEQTEGPYFIAREKVRRNITEGRPGTPLRLRLAVVDATTCKPIKNAVVDIWHCDAGGVYSGFMSASTGGGPPGGAGPTDKRTFLRGIQRTNSKGIAQFDTIYPGWYRGRTVHIHVKVHLGGSLVGHVVHTGQLFFPDTLTSKVYASGVYKARAAGRDTFNSTDSIYGSGGRQSTLALKRGGHGGFMGTITLGVRRS